MKTGADLVAEAKSRINRMTVREAMDARRRGDPIIFLDVRDLHEVNLGRIPGAVHLSRGSLETKIESLVPREAHVVIYCATDNRSALAAATLMDMGYEHVASMTGGYRDWVMNGGEVEG